MPRQFNYCCTACGRRPDPDPAIAKRLLTAKVSVFKEIGYGGRTLRSRMTAWLCRQCLEADPDWNTGDRTFIDKVAQDRGTTD